MLVNICKKFVSQAHKKIQAFKLLNLLFYLCLVGEYSLSLYRIFKPYFHHVCILVEAWLSY
ncbi:hypothetical protein Hanom_Chr04g00342731 [Helianthus anomalus]